MKHHFLGFVQIVCEYLGKTLNPSLSDMDSTICLQNTISYLRNVYPKGYTGNGILLMFNEYVFIYDEAIIYRIPHKCQIVL